MVFRRELVKDKSPLWPVRDYFALCAFRFFILYRNARATELSHCVLYRRSSRRGEPMELSPSTEQQTKQLTIKRSNAGLSSLGARWLRLRLARTDGVEVLYELSKKEIGKYLSLFLVSHEVPKSIFFGLLLPLACFENIGISFSKFFF